jgi:hypothetical protein
MASGSSRNIVRPARVRVPWVAIKPSRIRVQAAGLGIIDYCKESPLQELLLVRRLLPALIPLKKQDRD